MEPPPGIPGPVEGAPSTLRPRILSLPELREAGLRTTDPWGFVLGTKASGSRLSGEWRGARSPSRGQAWQALPLPASPQPGSPQLPIQNPGSATDRCIKGRQIWGD